MIHKRTGTVYSAAYLVLMLLSGCGPCGRGFSTRAVTGTALDAESRQPLGGAVIEIRTSTDGDANAHGTTALRNSQPPDSETGAFEANLISNFSGGICGGLFPTRLPEIPLPDEMKVTVILDGCEQELTIAINDDTAVEITEGGRVTEIQLLDPILVPPCPPPTDETPEPESAEQTE